MKMKTTQCYDIVLGGLLALAFAPEAASAATNSYDQVNLAADIATNALHHDSRLVNPWGMVASPEVVWVNDNGPGLATAYGPDGHVESYAIHVPGPAWKTNGGTPSGLVFNETESFVITNATGKKHDESTFLIATEDGTIAAWNQAITGSNAMLVVDRSSLGAVYKGLAIAHGTNGEPQIYAANFHAGAVDVFDGHFQYLGFFTDPALPALFAPFNIRHIRGYLFVTFAKQKLPDMHDDDAGPGNGYVDIFGTDGTLLRHFAANGALNSPWGMVVAPGNFGEFSHTLLVGNFGDGRINAFDLLTGQTLGHLTRENGNDLVIDGLWALTFEREKLDAHDCDFRADRLYFTAGLNGEADGLLGFIHLDRGDR